MSNQFSRFNVNYQIFILLKVTQGDLENKFYWKQKNLLLQEHPVQTKYYSPIIDTELIKICYLFAKVLNTFAY